METIIKFIITVALAGILLALLPASPFTQIINMIADFPYLGELNYFIPVGKIVAVSTIWATAVMTYYVVSWVLRQLDILGA